MDPVIVWLLAILALGTIEFLYGHFVPAKESPLKNAQVVERAGFSVVSKYRRMPVQRL
jgi:hypothetical protein